MQIKFTNIVKALGIFAALIFTGFMVLVVYDILKREPVVNETVTDEPLKFGAVSIYEDFESYSAGSLADGAGGSGWSAAWPSSGSCDLTVQTSVVNAGVNAVGDTAGTASGCGYRTFTAASAGTFYISVHRTGSISNGGGFQIKSASGVVMFCQFRTSGTIFGCANQATGNYEDVGCGAVSTGTWYRVGVDWDDGAQDNKFRVNCNNGSWTAYKTAYNDMSTVNGILLYGSNAAGQAVYYDSINTAYSPAENVASSPQIPPPPIIMI